MSLTYQKLKKQEELPGFLNKQLAIEDLKTHAQDMEEDFSNCPIWLRS